MVVISFLATIPSAPYESVSFRKQMAGRPCGASLAKRSSVEMENWTFPEIRALCRAPGSSILTMSTSTPCLWKNPCSFATKKGPYPTQVTIASLTLAGCPTCGWLRQMSRDTIATTATTTTAPTIRFEFFMANLSSGHAPERNRATNTQFLGRLQEESAGIPRENSCVHRLRKKAGGQSGDDGGRKWGSCGADRP